MCIKVFKYKWVQGEHVSELKGVKDINYTDYVYLYLQTYFKSE